MYTKTVGEGLYGQKLELGAEAQTEIVKFLTKSMDTGLVGKKMVDMVERKRIECVVDNGGKCFFFFKT